ncbi:MULTISPECIES: restriction endonuclease subunit S [Aliivibrio]|uniref:Restriction endonuclease subunit S n=1 Tax=Aliivibrio finisterrensis TaxID=511998 RepID=A0A4Q5KW65_9GAMM|nr:MULTISPECIES: restriction endonuclease subunit S [Aliivibrio]MDD9178819.1 restriction endonuclease subunit S [Aliivibrio sp. A6]RYU50189.1 restriction endonuclease subunit S [Aliivibrio finisterrensis]RYU51031.1 restriction endonuclease subunit S [Aliivibrio finisterrensis]RYU56911.1 restriction endonuclease subunit S [Aliivibrio finisterrensis]RYU62871.1 restriction endonuclease subunit S [Aliivibrio finisterrensis]
MSEFVPEGWKVSSVSEVANNFDGKRVALKSTDRAARQGRYRYYGASNIIDYVDDYIFDGDYILLGEDGENVLSRNLPLAFIVKGKFWVNNHAHVLQPKKNIDIGYLCEVLEAFNYKNIASGSAQPKITQGALNQISLLFPPLPEQQKIAAILTSVDEVIEKTQAQINKLKDLKTGMMQELLTRGVGVDGKPHTEFKDSPVGRIPKGWKVLPLADVAERVIDCEHKTAPYVEKSEYMVVRTSNVRNGELVLEDMKFTHSDGFKEWTKRAVPSNGDVLFTREAPAGESCLVPSNVKVCMGQRMVLLRPNSDVIDADFFSIFLTSEMARKRIFEMSIGTTVSRINIEDIKKIPCVLPPKSEQKKIALAISSIQNLLRTKQQRMVAIKNNKKALMQDLLTGKVRVKVDTE